MARGKPPASSGQHGYTPPPRTLAAFPDAFRVQPKGTRRRWLDERGFLYEWDYRHGAVEVYDSRGRHVGEFDHRTGQRLKPADPRRRIDPASPASGRVQRQCTDWPVHHHLGEPPSSPKSPMVNLARIECAPPFRGWITTMGVCRPWTRTLVSPMETSKGCSYPLYP